MSDKILKLDQAQTLYQDLRGRIDALPTSGDIPEVPVQDVQVAGTSVVGNDGVAAIPYAENNIPGLFYSNTTSGFSFNRVNGIPMVQIKAATPNQMQAGIESRRAIVPGFQQYAIFYGLAKAAGDTTQSQSSNEVGIYTAEAKIAIQNMLDVPAKADIPEVPVQDVQVNGTSIIGANGVANVPIAGNNELGVVKVNSDYGITKYADGTIRIYGASNAEIKSGSGSYKAITQVSAPTATFYGLAKAAGDMTQSQSSNSVGTYTAEAKAAIKTMLGVEEGLKVVRLI